MFVHCGLHKTGTTAIQTVFAEHRDRLRAHGVLYPSSGSHQVGHHNLAWELTGDRRFDPAALTLARVVREIAGFGGDVVLSSEDFESILDRADLIAPLLRRLGATGRDIRVVVYARQSTAYAESLYLELLKHDYTAPFPQFVREIRSGGAVRFREWTFQFDRTCIAAGLAAAGQRHVTWRSFEDAARHGGVVADFLALLGCDPRLPDHATAARRNGRADAAASLRLFCGGRLARELSDREMAVIARLCDRAPARLAAGPRCQLDGRTATTDMARLERVYTRRTVTAVTAIARLAARRPDVARGAERALVHWWRGGLAPVSGTRHSRLPWPWT